MTRVNKTPLLILSVAILVFLLLRLANSFFMLNTSSSMPIGLYRIEKHSLKSTSQLVYNKGDIVAICLNKTDRDLGLRRDYILAGDKCETSEPLIKTIFAAPGDDVVLQMNDIIINGKAYPYPTSLVDSEGRPLNIFKRGSYLKTSQYWLIGTNNPKSWDSRYWGPVTPPQILFRLTPLLTFK